MLLSLTEESLEKISSKERAKKQELQNIPYRFFRQNSNIRMKALQFDRIVFVNFGKWQFS